MEVQQENILESVSINFNKSKNQYWSSAEIRIDGYLIKIEMEYYNTIDDSVKAIKEKIVKAIDKFYSIKSICKKCGGSAIKSKGFGNAYLPQNEIGTKEVLEGKGKLIDCLKCSKCGHSWIPPNEEINNTKRAEIN